MWSRTNTPSLPVPRRTGALAVGGGHTLAWQEYGDPRGTPVLVLHGGPGSAFSPALLRGFDLDAWRVIGFDQRGCGASMPTGATAGNDTAHLLQDIETLRLSFALPRWWVVGGSWGATLGLAYAGRHPQAISGLLLRALFVPDAAELRWFFHGARSLAPQAWENLATLAPRSARGDLIPWLAAVFEHGRAAVQGRVALAWLGWEHALAGSTPPAMPDLPAAIARYRVQSHYLVHRCWLGDGALRASARAVPPVPVRFIHGSADVVCRPAAARALHALIPGSHFQAVPHAGHDPTHPAMAAAMQAALHAALQHGTPEAEGDAP